MDFDAGCYDWGADSLARGLLGLRAVRRRYLAFASESFNLDNALCLMCIAQHRRTPTSSKAVAIFELFLEPNLTMVRKGTVTTTQTLDVNISAHLARGADLLAIKRAYQANRPKGIFDAVSSHVSSTLTEDAGRFAISPAGKEVRYGGKGFAGQHLFLFTTGAWTPFQYPAALRPVLRRLSQLGFNIAAMEG